MLIERPKRDSESEKQRLRPKEKKVLFKALKKKKKKLIPIKNKPLKRKTAER